MNYTEQILLIVGGTAEVVLLVLVLVFRREWKR